MKKFREFQNDLIEAQQPINKDMSVKVKTWADFAGLKFTKSEEKIIRQMLQQGGRTSVERIQGAGPKGGTISGGNRMSTAARSLVKRGIITRTSCDKMQKTRNGFCVHIWASMYHFA